MSDIVDRLLEPDRHDPKCPFKNHCHCGDDAPHDTVRHPLAAEAAGTIIALRKEVDAAKADAALARQGYETAYAESDRKCRAVNKLAAELAEANSTIVSFAAPWAVTYARDYGLPEGHLHPTHYDILTKAGGRMDDFTRGALAQEPTP